MCMQYGFPQSSMSGMPGPQPFNPTMPCCCTQMQPMAMTGPSMPLPIPNEIQLQQLHFQLQQLKFMKQNLEQSLEFVNKSTSETERIIKKLESTKSNKANESQADFLRKS
ncbi:MAG: hypothetical protein KBG98_07010 [Desulfobacter sp.]|nr:hypothetical protein [Desulfobacter sp.]